MPSRGQSLTVAYVAWDTSANAGKTGDAANHTLRWIKDGTSAAPTNGPTEVDATNAPGVYKITLTAAECACDAGVLAGKSSTANVALMPVTITFEQLPTAAPAANGGVPTVDANNRIAGIQGSQNTLDDLNDVSTAEVKAQCDQALSDYDAVVAADLPSNFAALAITPTTGKVTVGTNDDKTGYALSASERNSIADAVFVRDMDQVETGAPEHSLCTIVLAALESEISGTTWTIKRTDGSTTHAVKTVAKDAAAEPITGVS